MVSIIIPIYNSEKSIIRCVSSLMNQTYHEIEIILVNDGSVDKSEDICLSLCGRDSRIKYYLKENGGAASARNYGLSKSTGDFIMFVDSDDYTMPNMVETMIQYQSKDNVDWVICGIKVISKYKKNVISFGESLNLNTKAFGEIIAQYYSKAIIHSPCNKLYKRSLIKEYMNTDFKWGEDYVFNVMYMKNIHTVSVISNPLYVYDCVGDSVTRSGMRESSLLKKQRYLLTFNVLHETFCSKKLESIVTEHFILELFNNLTYSYKLFIPLKQLKYFIDSNRQEIKRIIPDSKLTKALIDENIYMIQALQFKAYIKNKIKASLKKLLK